VANDVVPMPKLFQACSKVLDDNKRPMHYRGLTLAGLQKLGRSKEGVNWTRQIEDVREKMLEAGQYGTFYLGKPYCLAAKRDWFITDRFFAPIGQSQRISIDPGLIETVTFEALMRQPYMQKKNPFANEGRRLAALAKGLAIEAPVKQFFREQWPDFYLQPDNEGKWTIPCDHDFWLLVDGYRWKIDVCGPNQYEEYRNPGQGKKSVAFHLLCRRESGYIIWEAVHKGENFQGTVTLENAISPLVFIVFLNCYKYGVPYDELKQAALRWPAVR